MQLLINNYTPILREGNGTWKILWTEEPGGLQSMGLLESDMTERPQKSPDTPGSLEGNTEGPGTASSEPLLPS